MSTEETKAKHTPSPWLISKNDSTFIYALTESRWRARGGPLMVNRFSCRLEGGNPESASAEEMAANARLIAAAPDLLFALERILADLPTNRDWLDPAVEKFARAAVAKAKGEDV